MGADIGTLSSHVCYLPHFVILVQTVEHTYRDPPQNALLASRFSRSLEIVELPWIDRQEFLLLIYGHISYHLRLRDKRQSRSKIANFLTLRVFNVPADGVPLEILLTEVGAQKSRMVPLLDLGKHVRSFRHTTSVLRTDVNGK